MRSLYGTVLAAALILPGSLAAQSKEAAKALDDSVIVGIFDAANVWDIATGSLAATRAARKEVKDFGAMLARDHKFVRDSARKLAAKVNVAPVPVPADFPLKVAHEAAIKKLSALSGPDFDKAFLEHEIAYHKAVGDALNKSLLPGMKSPELKAFVAQVAPAFAAHQLAAETLLKKQ